jgi:hypothetical protein
MKTLTRAALSLVLIITPAPSRACTIFYAARGDVVLAGNNEDWNDPDTRVWFVPPVAGRFGGVFFGYGDRFPQGGMNERGLFFDGAALEPGSQLLIGDATGDSAILELPDPTEAARQPGRREWTPEGGRRLVEDMMARCGTVEAALKALEAVGPGTTTLRKRGSFQVATNFRQSKTPPSRATCERFKAAERLLSGAAPSRELFRRILKETHAEGEYPTEYSNIYDLKRRTVVVFFRHDFGRSLEIDLAEELRRGRHEYKLSELARKIR